MVKSNKRKINSNKKSNLVRKKRKSRRIKKSLGGTKNN